jgi:uncharacterized membrane protein YbhN (UPF0104 family)
MPQGGKSRHPLWKILKPVLIALVIGFFLWLLAGKLKGLTLASLLESLSTFSSARIGAALGLTALNYLILIGYDFIAVRYLQHPVSFKRIAFGSLVGYAMSFNFGWILGGSTVRYRLYSAWGFSAMEIAQLIATLTLTFWVGVFALAGVAFLAAPPPLPATIQQHLGNWLPAATARPLGGVFLAAIAAYLVLCGVWHKPLRWKEWSFVPPPLGLSVIQTVVASLDQLVAASVFYVLLPDEVRAHLGFFKTVNIYLLFTVVSALLHVPGGLGVLEQIVMDTIQSGTTQDLAATLVVYRAVYYLVPLAIAGALMLGHEIYLHRQEATGLAEAAPRKGKAL